VEGVIDGSALGGTTETDRPATAIGRAVKEIQARYNGQPRPESLREVLSDPR
jgi:hypothetical protein